MSDVMRIHRKAQYLIKQSADCYRMLVTHTARVHIDQCDTCWRDYQKLRWQLASTTCDYNELREYLGDDFHYVLDSSWQLSTQWQSQSRDSMEAVERFYESAEPYIYNLTIWHASGQRPRYVKMFMSNLFSSDNIGTVLDFGAGVGTDALEFAHRGLKVTAVEYDNASSRFMRWRFNKRRLNLTYCRPADQVTTAKFDLLWCMDVIEHLMDPIFTLAPYLAGSEMFVFDYESDSDSSGRHPFHFRHDYVNLEKRLNGLGFMRRLSTQKTVTSLQIFERKTHAD